MSKPLQGKVAWITGGGSGIGQAGALALAADGAIAVLSGRRAEALEATAKQIAQTKSHALTDAEARLAEAVSAHAGHLAETGQAQAKAVALASEGAAAQKLAAERKTQIDQLEKQLGEVRAKLSSVRKEMNRAEGQITLITDLLLRGGGL